MGKNSAIPITPDELRRLDRVQRDMLVEIMDNTNTDIDRGIITLPRALEVMVLIGRILERAELAQRKGRRP